MSDKPLRSVQPCITPTAKVSRKRFKPNKYTPDPLEKYSDGKKAKKVFRVKRSSISEFETENTNIQGKKKRGRKQQDDNTTESSEDECLTPIKTGQENKVITDDSDKEPVKVPGFGINSGKKRKLAREQLRLGDNSINIAQQNSMREKPPAHVRIPVTGKQNVTKSSFILCKNKVITDESDEEPVTVAGLGINSGKKGKLAREQLRFHDNIMKLTQQNSMQEKPPVRTRISVIGKQNLTNVMTDGSDDDLNFLEDANSILPDQPHETEAYSVLEDKNESDSDEGKSREQESSLDDSLDSSLIASTHKGKMIDLGDTGYSCVEAIYYSATSNGEKKETILARRLLDGVIKPEVIAQSTLSGRPARAQGPERQRKSVTILHPGAVAAIKQFARSWALKYKGLEWKNFQDALFDLRT